MLGRADASLHNQNVQYGVFQKLLGLECLRKCLGEGHLQVLEAHES